MDHQRFDELTRLIASGTSRRRVIKSLLGGLAGGALGLRATANVRAQDGDCEDDEDCDPGEGCFVGSCRQTCETDADCTRGCEGCFDGLCFVVACAPGTLCCEIAPGEFACSECCSSVQCLPGEVCANFECAPGPDTCTTTTDCGLYEFCCQGECITDILVECCDDFDCDEGETCVEMTCVGGPTCADVSDPCEVHTDCCEGLACFASVCQEPNPCRSEGQGCDGNLPQGFSPCCEGLTCNDANICEVACAEEGEECIGGAASGPDCCGSLFCKHAEGEPGICVAVCGETGDACEELLDCCAPDFVCNTDTNLCESAGTGCTDEGGSCTHDDNCCDTLVCRNTTCIAEAATCGSDADCNQVAIAGESMICCDGVCLDAQCCMEDENPNERCDPGEVCFEGVCIFVCKGDADCASGTCCCADGTCSSGCCEGAVAPTDTGGVTALPSTGIGDGGVGLSGLLGAGIAAAGAAYLAGKKVRSAEESKGG